MSALSWLSEDIQSLWRIDLILLVLTFASSMMCVVLFSEGGQTLTLSGTFSDTMTVPTVKVFVANNTGNLLLLGLGAAGLHSQYPDLVYPDRAGVALLGAWVGSFVTGKMMNLFGKRKRFWIVGEFAFEAFLVFLSVILLYTHVIDLTGKSNLGFIFMLGWVFGSQGVVTKTLGVPTIPAQVVTGAMADLLSDPKLFAPLRANVGRNQRLAFILVFFAGACIGGTILVKVNAELVLLLVAVFKLIVAGLFLVVPGVPRKVVEVDEERQSAPPEVKVSAP